MQFSRRSYYFLAVKCIVNLIISFQNYCSPDCARDYRGIGALNSEFFANSNCSILLNQEVFREKEEKAYTWFWT